MISGSLARLIFYVGVALTRVSGSKRM